MIDPERERSGADNLLQNCAALAAGQSLLIVEEEASLGWYAGDLGERLAAAAGQLGVRCERLRVAAPGNQADPRVEAACRGRDVILFLSRIGDQGRFEAPPPGQVVVMSYIRSRAMLASPFATLAYAATRALKQTLDELLAAADEILIRCPLGSECRMASPPRENPLADVGIRRFPLGVVTPINAAGLSGRVVMDTWLTPTESRVYVDPNLRLDSRLIARVENGRIVAFDGEPALVAAVEAHYDRVATAFDLDRNAIHSWHIGLHPGLDYDQPAAADPDRWSNTVFNHPRLLHFHTCGASPPGEICWMVRDPTLLVDDRPLWRDGAILWRDFDRLVDLVSRQPALETMLNAPPGAIGL